MRRSKKNLFCFIILLLLTLTQLKVIIDNQVGNFDFSSQKEQENKMQYLNSQNSDKKMADYSITTYQENGKLVLEVNLTMQIVFVGYTSSVLHTTLLDAELQKEWDINAHKNIDYLVRYNINYEYIEADQTYYNSLKNAIDINKQLTTTSKINETALLLQANDGIQRSIFLDQTGYGINGTAIDYWINSNLYSPVPTNGYSIYLLNYSIYDSPDHSIEHWFEFDDKNIDSNQTIEWFRLEWDNALNPDVRFPYPGFDSKIGRRFILDPSAYQWYNRWYILWWYKQKIIEPYDYSFQDLEDLQRNYSLQTNPEALAYYLDEYLSGVIKLMIRDGSLGSERYTPSKTVSLQTLVLNGDDEFNKPLEDITWVTNEERLFSQLNQAMPFLEWQVGVTFANLSDYPIITNAIQTCLRPTNVTDFWEIDANDFWQNINNRKHLLFDLNAADTVITACVIIRKDMVMKLGMDNFTGMGGDGNVIVLKSRDRYFGSDGITPKSGVTDVLIHEIGHNLGFGHPEEAGQYSRGTMTYYNTRHELNTFYQETLRRGMVEKRYCEVLIDYLEDQRRFGSGPFNDQIEIVIQELETALATTVTRHNEMNYLLAIESIDNARNKMDLLQTLRDATFGRIRNIGNNSLGAGETVFVEGKTAYVSAGQQLLLFDVTNPTEPTVLSRLERQTTSVDIYYSNGYLFLSNTKNGFSIVDVNNPLKPRNVASITDCGLVTDVHVEGNYAIVAITPNEFEYGLRIYDITNPENPVEINKLCYEKTFRRAVVANQLIYTATRAKFHNGTPYSALEIYNFTNPFNIKEIAVLYDTEYCYTVELFLMGNNLYACQMTGSGNYLTEFDISDTNTPQFNRAVNIDDVVIDCHITTAFAYLACNEKGLVVIAMSSFTEIANFDTPSYSYGLFVEGSYAYLADIAYFRIIDISVVTAMNEVHSFELLPASSNFMAKKDDLLYISDAIYGIAIMNISDLTNPQLENYFHIFEGVMDIEIDQNYLFATVYPNQFYILDITDPINPIIQGYCNTSGLPYRFEIRNNYAFVPTSGRLMIIDISDKTNPNELSGYDTVPYLDSLVVDGDLLYINCESYGLQIANISDVNNPIILSTTDFGVAIHDLVVKDNNVIISHDNGLIMIDASNPIQPEIISNFTMSKERPVKLELDGNRLYIACYEDGFHVYDISNIHRPLEIGYNTTLKAAKDVLYIDGVFYVTNYRGGCWIFDHDLDNDLLFSREETEFGSDPFLYDTDQDGYSDYEEWQAGTNPNDPNDYPGSEQNTSKTRLIIGLGLIAGSYSFGVLISIAIIVRRRK